MKFEHERINMDDKLCSAKDLPRKYLEVEDQFEVKKNKKTVL